MSDTVNHPRHYNQNGIECIDVIEAAIGCQGAADFCMGNAIKYLYRHTMKGQPVEDVRKAIWYLNKWLDLQTESEQGCPFDESEELRESEEGLLRAFAIIKGSENDESDVSTT